MHNLWTNIYTKISLVKSMNILIIYRGKGNYQNSLHEPLTYVCLDFIKKYIIYYFL